jgi:hypothetical protein
LFAELVTEGDILREALEHVSDAVQAVVDLYVDLNKPLPEELSRQSQDEAISFDYAVAIPYMNDREAVRKLRRLSCEE